MAGYIARLFTCPETVTHPMLTRPGVEYLRWSIPTHYHYTSHQPILSCLGRRNSPQCECRLLCLVQEMVERKPLAASPQPISETWNGMFVLCQAVAYTSSSHQSDWQSPMLPVAVDHHQEASTKHNAQLENYVGPVRTYCVAICLTLKAKHRGPYARHGLKC